MTVNWPAVYGGVGLVAAGVLAKLASIEGRWQPLARWAPALAIVLVGMAAAADVMPSSLAELSLLAELLLRRDVATLALWGALGAVVRWAPPFQRGASGAFLGGLATGGLPMVLAVATGEDKPKRTALAAWALAGGLLSPLGPFNALLGRDAWLVSAPIAAVVAVLAAIVVRPEAPRITRAGYGMVAGALIGIVDPLTGLVVALAGAAAGPTGAAPPAGFMAERAGLAALGVAVAHAAGALVYAPRALELERPHAAVVLGVSALFGALVDPGAIALALARTQVVEPSLWAPWVVAGAAAGSTVATLLWVYFTPAASPNAPRAASSSTAGAS